jgi:alkanesulfonate monooxygenase SsuD/methylene tetrahydromethanopterin reductase-like flavin-dependent oxidoreductase (luciferase family)
VALEQAWVQTREPCHLSGSNIARKTSPRFSNITLTGNLHCSVRRDGERARDDVAKFLGSAYGGKPQAMLDRIAPSGTPEQVVERLQEYVDAGVRHFIISPAAQCDTLEVVTLAAREVLPRLRVPAATA